MSMFPEVNKTVMVVVITIAGIFGGVIGPAIIYVNGYRNGYQACESKLLPHINRILDERDDARKGI